MAWFSHLTREIVSLTPEEIRPTVPAPLTGIDPDRTADAVGQGLRAARERLTALETEGRRIESEAEKTRLSIAALEAADKVLVAADPDFAEVEPVSLQGHTAEFAATDLIIEDGKIVKSKYDDLTGPAPVGARLVPRNTDAAA